MQLRTYYQIIMRRWWIMAVATVVGVGGVALNGYLWEPKYQATATIAESGALSPVANTVIDRSERMPLRREERLAGLTAVLQTNVMMQRVIRRLNLPMTPDQLKQTVVIEPVDRFSEVLAITVEGRDPKMLTRIANTFAVDFAEFYHSITRSVARRKREFLTAEVGRARTELEGAEQRLRDFEAEHRAMALQTQVPAEVSEQVRLRSELQTAEVDIRLLTAVLSDVRAQMAKEPETSVSGTTFTANPAVQSLRTRLSDLEERLATLLRTRTEQHAEVVAVKQEIEAVKDRLRRETVEEVGSRTQATNPVYAMLREKYATAAADLAAARARASALRRVLSGQETRVQGLAQAESLQTRVLLERETARATYSLLADKRDQALLEEREVASTGPIQVVDLAKRALPASKLPLRLLMALILSPFLGATVILVLHTLRDTVHSVSDVESLLQLPVFAAIPALRGADSAGVVAGKPGLSEPYEMLRAGLLFGQRSMPTSCIAVASAAPGAGKSTVTANLAVTLARDGHEVILVDADLHRPAQHRLLHVPNRKGLTTVLRGMHLVSEALQPTRWPRLRVMTSGPPAGNPAGLLSSEQMQAVAASLREMASVVIFDTPAGGAFADVFYIVALTGNVLLVTAAGQAHSEVEIAFRDQLVRMDARIVGSVINKVRTDRDARYYYYRDYRYHRRESGNGAPAADEAEADASLRPGHPVLPAGVRGEGGAVEGLPAEGPQVAAQPEASEEAGADVS